MKAPRIACCPLRAFASHGRARGAEGAGSGRAGIGRARGAKGKPPRFVRCLLRAGAPPGCARGAERKHRESHVSRSALSRLADAREGLIRRRWRNLRSPTGASRGRAQGAEGKRRESHVSRSALSRLTDAREGLKKSAAIRALPVPRFRVSWSRAKD